WFALPARNRPRSERHFWQVSPLAIGRIWKSFRRAGKRRRSSGRREHRKKWKSCVANGTKRSSGLRDGLSPKPSYFFGLNLGLVSWSRRGVRLTSTPGLPRYRFDCSTNTDSLSYPFLSHKKKKQLTKTAGKLTTRIS